MTDQDSKDPFFSTPGSAEVPSRSAKAPSASPGVARFVLLWFVLPATLVGALLLTGVHYGARHPDAWYTATVRWLASLE